MAPAAGRTQQGAATRPIPAARFGDSRRRRSTAWLVATLSVIGVFAVIALIASLVFFKQPDTVAVPDVRGKSPEAAQGELRNAGLQPVPGEDEFNDSCQKGQVASQDPLPTAGQVERNSTVTFRVCGGKPTKEVPTGLVGGPFDYVKSALEREGFQVKRNDVNSEKREGEVVRLNPESGKKVAEGSVITVDVSKGNIKPVPDVVGLTEDDARDRLVAAGFKVNVEDGAVVSPENAGRVTAQSPRAEEKKTTGTTITITVSQARSVPTPTATSTPTAPGE